MGVASSGIAQLELYFIRFKGVCYMEGNRKLLHCSCYATTGLKVSCREEGLLEPLPGGSGSREAGRLGTDKWLHLMLKT